jgi:hypothetical protein
MSASCPALAAAMTGRNSVAAIVVILPDSRRQPRKNKSKLNRWME